MKISEEFEIFPKNREIFRRFENSSEEFHFFPKNKPKATGFESKAIGFGFEGIFSEKKEIRVFKKTILFLKHLLKVKLNLWSTVNYFFEIVILKTKKVT